MVAERGDNSRWAPHAGTPVPGDLDLGDSLFGLAPRFAFIAAAEHVQPRLAPNHQTSSPINDLPNPDSHHGSCTDCTAPYRLRGDFPGEDIPGNAGLAEAGAFGPFEAILRDQDVGLVVERGVDRLLGDELVQGYRGLTARTIVK